MFSGTRSVIVGTEMCMGCRDKHPGLEKFNDVFKLGFTTLIIPYMRYFSRVLYFADNLSGRIFAFKLLLMIYL